MQRLDGVGEIRAGHHFLGDGITRDGLGRAGTAAALSRTLGALAHFSPTTRAVFNGLANGIVGHASAYAYVHSITSLIALIGNVNDSHKDFQPPITIFSLGAGSTFG